MSKEIEAQIAGVKYDEIIKKIKEQGATMKFDWTVFRIAVFFPCLSREQMKEKYDLIFTRVRDEGSGKRTITTKTRPKGDTDKKFVKEYEIDTTNTFDECKDLLVANHLEMKAYQERLRQKWTIPGNSDIKEIVFDIWAGLPLYMEVEASSNEKLESFLSKLQIDKKNIRYEGATGFYKEVLGIPNDTINNEVKILDFKSAEKVLGEHTSDKSKLSKIISEQKELLTKIGFSNMLSGGRNKKTSRKSNKSSRKPSKKISKRPSRKSSKKTSRKSS